MVMACVDVDVEKAYDRVGRVYNLWYVLEEYGDRVKGRLLRAMRSLYEKE